MSTSPGRCRAPQGARGLKCQEQTVKPSTSTSRAPQGARGLKYRHGDEDHMALVVAPRKGRVG